MHFSRGAGDNPPDTTPQQVYRQVREYHDRYPEKAIVAWHSGAGPVPVLMAGGAEALMRNPSAGQGQGTTVDRTPLDAFVREHLARSLMNMQPRDGMAGDAENTWCLTDDRRETVLVYSLSGPSVSFTQTPRATDTGLWFDPRTGKTQPADAVSQVMAKPTSEAWLLLLRAK